MLIFPLKIFKQRFKKKNWDPCFNAPASHLAGFLNVCLQMSQLFSSLAETKHTTNPKKCFVIESSLRGEGGKLSSETIGSMVQSNSTLLGPR